MEILFTFFANNYVENTYSTNQQHFFLPPSCLPFLFPIFSPRPVGLSTVPIAIVATVVNRSYIKVEVPSHFFLI